MKTFSGFGALWKLNLKGHFLKGATCAIGLVLKHIVRVPEHSTSFSKILLILESSTCGSSYQGCILLPLRVLFPQKIESLTYTLIYEQSQDYLFDFPQYFLLTLEEFLYFSSFVLFFKLLIGTFDKSIIKNASSHIKDIS
jgi:hypothetical protein